MRVIYTRGAGCYGINGADTVTYDAAVLSQAVGKPVRVQLSRKDEMAWENYGNLVRDRSARRPRRERHDRRVGLRGLVRSQGRPARLQHAWQRRHRIAPRLQARAVHPAHAGAGADDAAQQQLNTAPSYIAGRVRRLADGAGVVRSERVLSHRVRSPFFTGPLRAPERLQNTFAHECFMDEIAAHVKADPVAYRLRHLSHPRLSEAVAHGGQGRELAGAAVAASRRRSRPASSAAAASPASATKATTATSRWSPRSTSIRTPGRST